VVHVAKGLQGWDLVDEVSQVGRGTAKTRRGIGLLLATIDRMRPGSIGSGHGAEYASSIHNRYTHPVAVFVTGVQRCLDRLAGQTYGQDRLFRQLISS